MKTEQIDTTHIFKDKRSNTFNVAKWWKIKGKNIGKHYGSFKTLEEAIEFRDLCRQKNWDEKLRSCNNPTLHNPMKYIKKTPAGNYKIEKWENGTTEHYGTYLTLFDAMQERDLLIKHNWDYDAVCNVDERICGITIFNSRRVD